MNEHRHGGRTPIARAATGGQITAIFVGVSPNPGRTHHREDPQHKRTPRTVRFLSPMFFPVGPPENPLSLAEKCRGETDASAASSPSPPPDVLARREYQRRWRAANPEKVAANKAQMRAKYAATRRPPPSCSECGVEMENRARVICSRRCKDKRNARLNPEAVKAKRARKDARRQQPKVGS